MDHVCTPHGSGAVQLDTLIDLGGISARNLLQLAVLSLSYPRIHVPRLSIY